MNTVIMHLLLVAMAFAESSLDPTKVNPVCGGTGFLQITQIMLDDVNRIVGYERWEPEDRFDIIQSYEMAHVYFDHYCEGYTAEQMARCWNQGKTSWLRDPSLSDDYWATVSSVYIASLERRLK